jgi:hypothetical protein
MIILSANLFTQCSAKQVFNVHHYTTATWNEVAWPSSSGMTIDQTVNMAMQCADTCMSYCLCQSFSYNRATSVCRVAVNLNATTNGGMLVAAPGFNTYQRV